MRRKGYRYHNLEIAPRGGGAVIMGDAHQLPFTDGAFSLVVSNDSLEHFLRPQEVVCEVRRVLKEGGSFVVQVPFMHPFHGDDTYRYTPLGLRYLLVDVAGLELVRIYSPL